MKTLVLPKVLIIATALGIASVLFSTSIVMAETDAAVETSATVTNEERPKPPVAPNILDRLKTLRTQNTGSAIPPKERPASTTMEKRPLIDLRNATATRAKLLQIASSTRAAIGARIENIKEKREDMREKRETRLAEIKEKVSERAFTSIRAIIERLGNAHEKLTDLLTKIGDTLERGATAGKDVTAAEAALATAQADLAAAGTAIDAVETALGTAVDTAEPKQHMQRIRTAVEAATDAIKKAHQSTLEAMKQARIALAVSINAEASTENN